MEDKLVHLFESDKKKVIERPVTSGKMAQAIKLSELTNRKRKVDQNGEESEESDIDISSSVDTSSSESDEDGDGNEEIVNIDFDFFNGDPNVDFHALKNLSRQLFGPQESSRMQLSKLADLILESPTTTIKTDGTESDPYSFLSFINYKENRDSDYANYLRKVDPRLQTFLQTIDSNSDKSCALVISERLINMPGEVVPPLYKITLEDVTKTLGDDKHYDFYIIASRKYEVNFDMDSDDDSDDDGANAAHARSKKRVKQVEVDYFHIEDRHFEENAKLKFQSEPRKGIINSYIVLDHSSLLKSLQDLEQEIQTW